MFYERLFACLNRHGIRYLVVGGVAVNLHGFPRLTMDVDIAVDAETDQSALWEKVCAELRVQPRQPVSWAQMYSRADRHRLREENNLIAFCILSENPSDPVVDLLFDLEAPFAELWERRKVVPVDGFPTPLIGLDDLLEMKEKAGRPKDLADIAHITGQVPPDEGPYS